MHQKICRRKYFSRAHLQKADKQLFASRNVMRSIKRHYFCTVCYQDGNGQSSGRRAFVREFWRLCERAGTHVMYILYGASDKAFEKNELRA